MIAIYKKEMLTYFTNMMGYVFLTFMILLVGIWFSLFNVRTGNPNYHTVLGDTTFFFIILIPVLTMRLFSEEARQKTDQLLFTSPLSVIQIVMGKFFAATSLFLIGTIITIIFPLMLRNHGDLPISEFVGTYIGFVLIGLSLIAVGLFISVLTDNQIIAAVVTVAAVLVMFMIDLIAVSMPTSTFASFVFISVLIIIVVVVWYNSTKHILSALIVGGAGIAFVNGLYWVNNLIFEGVIVHVLLWVSLYSRFNHFPVGILSSSDIIYYISFVALFCYLTVNVIEKRRWR